MAAQAVIEHCGSRESYIMFAAESITFYMLNKGRLFFSFKKIKKFLRSTMVVDLKHYTVLFCLPDKFHIISLLHLPSTSIATRSSY